MTGLYSTHRALGADIAPDGVPLHYQNLPQSYQAIYTACVLMERPHEGRLLVKGRSAKSLLHRLGTQDIEGLSVGMGGGTVFLNANGRVLERVEVYVLAEDQLLLLTSPGHIDAVKTLLTRNIFFEDDVVLEDITPQTTQLVIHGASAEGVIRSHVSTLPDSLVHSMGIVPVVLHDATVWLIRRKTYYGSHWSLILHDLTTASNIWNLLTKHPDLTIGGALTFNMMRIACGIPSANTELTTHYIPLEVGLWDEISFTKGCYVGQEIVARMESRQQLAKVLVKVHAEAPILPNTPLLYGETNVGVITSATQLPTQKYVALATIKPAYRESTLTCDGVVVQLNGLAGSPPPSAMLKELIG
ncbi:MAG: YgfZ/GcvT domain-containing protein [Phototrophicaceae bacterium]